MIRLAGPLVLAELGWMARGVVDTMFVGRVSAEAIGAVGLVAQAFGAGDTRTRCCAIHLIGYWVIGLPLGVLLCFGSGLSAPGLWIGLSAGLIAIGLVLTAFWRLKSAA